MLLHSELHPSSRSVGAAIRRAGEAGLITDAGVNPLTTVAGLRALIAGPAHADTGPLRARILASLDAGVADGTLTDSAVAGANTVSGLAGLTHADRARTWGSID
jgi:hypothetical protein